MDWMRILAYVTGMVEQELLARNEYLSFPKTSSGNYPMFPVQIPCSRR